MERRRRRYAEPAAGAERPRRARTAAARDPLTRTQIGEQTGLSKVTAAQMLTRLEERGLVAVAGQQAGGRGPNAALYAVVPSSAYVAGLYVEMDLVSAGVADVTGRVVAEVSVNPNSAANPVELVRNAVDRACRTAGVEIEPPARVRHRQPWRGGPAHRRPAAGGQPARLARGRAGRAARRPAPSGHHRERRQPGRDGRALRRAPPVRWTTSCWSGSASASAWRRSSAAGCTAARRRCR